MGERTEEETLGEFGLAAMSLVPRLELLRFRCALWAGELVELLGEEFKPYNWGGGENG